jgi:hypothetical protein
MNLAIEQVIIDLHGEYRLPCNMIVQKAVIVAEIHAGNPPLFILLAK